MYDSDLAVITWGRARVKNNIACAIGERGNGGRWCSGARSVPAVRSRSLSSTCSKTKKCFVKPVGSEERDY